MKPKYRSSRGVDTRAPSLGRPPRVERVHPRHAPIAGRLIHFEGGAGPWGQYEGDVSTGGVLLLGSNFAPTPFLWCAFGMPEAVYTTARGPWKWTRGAYVNSSAVRCEVPAGYVGDFEVAASTDDRRFSTHRATLTYYDPLQTAQVAPGQQLALATQLSGYLKRVLDDVEIDETIQAVQIRREMEAMFAD